MQTLIAFDTQIENHSITTFVLVSRHSNDDEKRFSQRAEVTPLQSAPYYSYIFSQQGQLYGWTQAQCDKSFQNDMYKECERSITKKRFLSSVWNWLKGLVSDKVKRCKAGADVYYNAVYHFGHANFVKVSPTWCQASCVKSLGDPSKVLSG